MRIDSHDNFGRDRLEALGFDWGRAGDRDITPITPRLMYLPTTTSEVALAVKDANRVCADLQNASPNDKKFAFKIRGKGHSNNDLVLSDSEPVICTSMLNQCRNLRPNPNEADEYLVDVDAGTEIGVLEDWMSSDKQRVHCSLLVRPDHDHISVGGFASVGGVSTASHKYGLFVDTIEQIELVYRIDGSKAKLTKDDDDFRRALCGAGELGIITQLTCRVMPVNKRHRLLQADVIRYPSPALFAKAIRDTSETLPPSKQHIRGSWVDSGENQLGFLAKYKIASGEIEMAWHARHALIDKLEEIGTLAGRLAPAIQPLEAAVKQLGFQEIVRLMIEATAETDKKGKKDKQWVYFTDNDVETLTDRVIDYSVGSPMYMLAAFVPAEEFESSFLLVQGMCAAFRAEKKLAAFAIYARPVRSQYLSDCKSKSAIKKYADLSIFMLLPPKRDKWVEGQCAVKQIQAALDTKCGDVNTSATNKMFRYIATQTEFRPSERDVRDPNSQYW